MTIRAETNSIAQSVSEERRFDRRSWAMLALASAILLYSIALALYVALLPTDGWIFQFDFTQPNAGYRFTEYYGIEPSPVQSGDVLVAIEGKPVQRVFSEVFALQSPRPANWQAGSHVQYTVRRDGRDLTLDVPLVRLFPRGFLNYVSGQLGSPLFLLLPLAMIGIGFVVFMRRPRYLPAQLLLLFSWSLAGSQLAIAPTSVGVILDPVALFFVHTPIFISIWQVMILPTIAYLLLVFPVVKQPVSRHPRLILLALYAPVQIGTWLALALNLGRPAAVLSAWSMVQAIQILAILVLMILSVVHTFRTVRDATVLAQMRWITFGVLFGFMGSLFGWLFITLSGASSALLSLLVFPILLLPLSLAIAILRYRLFDIDFIIRRTLIYGVMSALLAIIFAGSVVALQALFRAITGQTSGVAIAISTLAIAALALPLRNRIQAAIDRAFYRQKYDAQKTLEAFLAGLQNQTDLEGLAAEACAVIQATLQPASVKVWLAADAAQASPSAAPGVQEEIARLAPDDPIIARLQRARGAVHLDRLRANSFALSSPALETMKEAGVVLAAPMVHQGEFIGLIALGPRLSEQGYTADDNQLLNNLATQAAPAFRVADLVREQRQEAQEHEQIEQELRVARSIQQTLLPKEQLALEGWIVEAHYQPARAVGGDFYDFIQLPDGRISLIIGDVSDKGVPAALVMAVSRTLLRDTTKLHDSPGAILSAANESLAGDIPEKMFVTCFYAILEPATGNLIYANAGHDVPFWRKRDEVQELRARGMPLGLMPGMTYEEDEVRLAPNETVLFYTDGLVEAHNGEREMFGLPRIVELIAGHPGGPDLVPYLLEHRSAFTGPGWEQEDDTTTIILQCVPYKIPANSTAA